MVPTLRTVSLPKACPNPPTMPAIQASQNGTFVFVVKDGVASVQPVKVARTLDQATVLESGLNGGETVVTEGQLLLNNGSKVSVRQPKVGS